MPKAPVFPVLPVISPKARLALTVGVTKKHSICLLEELGATQRMLNLFEKHGISTLEELLNNRPDRLLALPNFGEKQLILLFDCLSKYHELPN